MLDRPDPQTVADLVRSLAARMRTTGGFEGVVPDDDAAIRLFVDVVHAGACPRCRRPHWRPRGDRSLSCRFCGDVCVFARSVFSSRRLPPRILLATIFAVFVDTQTWTAYALARRLRWRKETIWRLLHEARSALPHVLPQQPGLCAPVLGGCEPDNERDVVVAKVPHQRFQLVVVEAGDGVVGCGRSELPLWWGRLRHWLNEHFRGVSPAWLGHYLSEFAARFGRVEREGALHV